MNQRIFILAFTLILNSNCRQSANDDISKFKIAGDSLEVNQSEINNYRDTTTKYEIKAGIVRYQVILKTISVDMRFHTILYFDDFGSKECKDTYSGDTLIESNMSDGIKTYKIDHRKKIAYYLGKAHFGIEPIYSWDKVAIEDKKSGKVKKLPNRMIAGVSCESYEVNTGIAKVTFAGWKKIIMLADVNSPGGRSFTLATYLNTEGAPAEKFLIPPHYSIKN